MNSLLVAGYFPITVGTFLSTISVSLKQKQNPFPDSLRKSNSHRLLWLSNGCVRVRHVTLPTSVFKRFFCH